MHKPLIRLGIIILVFSFSFNAQTALEFDFFEKEIRPLFHQHCYECHSAEKGKTKGGLVLDRRSGWAKGGDSGPAIVPGDPSASLLIRAIGYKNNDLKMPPKYRLTEAEQAALAKWVESGAPDPRSGEVARKPEEIDLAKGREFWAFRPVSNPQVPRLANALDQAEPLGPIDRFVLARLAKEGVEQVGLAKPETLLRRVYFDLVGLPPTPAQMDDFLSDPSQESYEQLVDQLLSSPQFGETWGRHWLDVARYAESSGGGRSLMFKSAWRYRDYVIDAFNRDKPFDEFIREQIAGDLLTGGDRKQKNERLIATGFLALGPHNYELQDKELLRMEVVDEQIDTVGRAFLAMTIGCARCHDHKFDPIPTNDYYALAGIFRSTQSLVPGNVSSWVERSLIPTPEAERKLDQHAKDSKDADLSLKAARKELQKIESNSGKAGVFVDNSQAEKIGEWMKSTSNKSFFGENYIHDKGEGKGQKEVVFSAELKTAGEYEVRVGYTHGTNRSQNVPVTIEHAKGNTVIRVNQREMPPINNNFKVLGRFGFDAGKASVTISNEGTRDVVIVDAVVFVPLAQLKKDPVFESRLAKLREDIDRLAKRVESLKNSSPGDASKSMSVQDQKDPGDWHVHIRGGIRNKGPIVPRGFLQVASGGQGEARATMKTGSGRRELAEWIASESNPLTRRVMVNRIWHHLMGQGLVRTTDNFGVMGELPSHPELLDWLAGHFARYNWSVKEMIRQIVMSRTYRLASEGDYSARSVDPENRLLWKANRKRLTAEAIRDSILAISGRLSDEQGGYTIRKFSQYDWGYEFDTVRRSVYVPLFRNTLMEVFETFDMANPNVVTGRRNETTLPTQALYLMNSPFVNGEAGRLGQRIAQVGNSDAERIRFAYRLTLGREPSAAEVELSQAFISTNDPSVEKRPWAALSHSLISSIQFRYLD